MSGETLTDIKIFFVAVASGLGATMTYLGVDTEAISLFSILLVIDYISGIVKAKKVNEPITSQKMRIGILSKLILVILPISVAVVAKIIGIENGGKQLAFFVINMLSISEFYSILSNVYAIKSGKELPEYDVIAAIAKGVRDYVTKLEGGTK